MTSRYLLCCRVSPVSEEDEMAREAQDTPVISVEMSSNRNESDPALQDASSSSSTKMSLNKKHQKPHHPNGKVAARPASGDSSNSSSAATLTTPTSSEETGVGSSGSFDKIPTLHWNIETAFFSFFLETGEACADKFKNCHLVVQARLCKLKYYLVSCCASCSKSKTWRTSFSFLEWFGKLLFLSHTEPSRVQKKRKYFFPFLSSITAAHVSFDASIRFFPPFFDGDVRGGMFWHNTYAIYRACHI